MFSMPEMPSSASKLLSAYASFAGTMMLVRSMANELIPIQLRSYLYSKVNNFLFTPRSSNLTLIIDEKFGMTRSQVYDAAETYLRTKINPSAERLRVGKTRRQKNITVSIEKGEEIVDSFDGIQLQWRFVCTEPKERSEKRSYELTFNKKFKDKVLESYLPCILAAAKEIKQKDKVVKLYSRDNIPSQDDDGSCRGGWGSIDFEHPSTFHTLAIDSELKKTIIADLERFVKRREFYKKVGKAWKRGYLLYGPPGTGKSSLIAAMANYLKFDVYDLELSRLYSNAAFRSVLLSTTNRSILVIEDIDCSSADIEDRQHGNEINPSNSKITLSGLLNFIDGLWSSCGDERIIIFTTNHKDRLDPALLRPGRMDMHIHMSYCSPQGFKILASNYLGTHGNNHKLCGEIEGMIKTTEVTPAEVAEELMKSDDPDEALGGLVNFLKRKSQGKEEEVGRKRLKTENNELAVGNIMERGDPEAGELTSFQ